MTQNPLEHTLSKLTAPVIEDLGFRLVQLNFSGGILQILAENPETGRIGVDDCARISRALSPALDVEDVINGAYRLEISSPGIDRPLLTSTDFRRYVNLEAKIELNAPIEEQKKFRGFIRDATDESVTLDTDQGPIELPLAHIHKAKPVMSDDLVKEMKKRMAPEPSNTEEIKETVKG